MHSKKIFSLCAFIVGRPCIKACLYTSLIHSQTKSLLHRRKCILIAQTLKWLISKYCVSLFLLLMECIPLILFSFFPCYDRNGLPPEKPVTEDVNVYQKYIARYANPHPHKTSRQHSLIDDIFHTLIKQDVDLQKYTFCVDDKLRVSTPGLWTKEN